MTKPRPIVRCGVSSKSVPCEQAWVTYCLELPISAHSALPAEPLATVSPSCALTTPAWARRSSMQRVSAPRNQALRQIDFPKE
jgi:hypothetical protein